MMKKTFLPIAILLFTLPITIQAMPPKFDKPSHELNKRPFHGKDLDLRFLNLTEEQSSQINKIADEYKKKIDLIMLELERNKLDFDEVMLTENYDFNRLKELIEIRKKHESNILIAFLERDLKIKDLLTEDQWKIFKKKFPKNINFCEQKNKCPKDKNRHNEKKDSKNYSQRKFRDK